MINATYDMIIVKVILTENSTIILPKYQRAREQNLSFYGDIVSIGPDCKYKELKIGDKLYFPRNEGFLIEWESERYMSLRNRWHLAKEE